MEKDMWCMIMFFSSGDVKAYGPFDSSKEAKDYQQEAEDTWDFNNVDYTVVELL